MEELSSGERACDGMCRRKHYLSAAGLVAVALLLLGHTALVKMSRFSSSCHLLRYRPM